MSQDQLSSTPLRSLYNRQYTSSNQEVYWSRSDGIKSDLPVVQVDPIKYIVHQQSCSDVLYKIDVEAERFGTTPDSLEEMAPPGVRFYAVFYDFITTVLDIVQASRYASKAELQCYTPRSYQKLASEPGALFICGLRFYVTASLEG